MAVSSFLIDKLLTVNPVSLLSTIGLIVLTFIALKLLIVVNDFIKVRAQLRCVPGPEMSGVFGDARLVWDFKLNKPSGTAIFSVGKQLADKFRSSGFFKVRGGNQHLVVVHQAEHFEKILSKSSMVEKGDMYRDGGHDWLGDGLLTSNGDLWRIHRLLLNNAFHTQIIDNSIVAINERSMVLRDKLFSKDVNEDTSKYLYLGMFDILMETAMGVKLDVINNPDLNYVVEMHRLTELLVEKLTNPFYAVSKLLFYLSSDGREYRKCIRNMHSFTGGLIKKRILEISSGKTDENENTIKKSKKRLAFLDLVLDLHFKGHLTEREVREQVETFTAGGYDTTGTSMTYTLYIIGRHPEVVKKLHEELDSVFGEDRDRDITTEDIKKLNYLSCVIKESLRLFPSVPVIIRKMVEDIEIGGHVIPAGIDVSMAIFLLHRDPAQFPEPERFDPDRWAPGTESGRHEYAYAPFAAGSRNCIAQKFARLALKVVVANILRKYSLRSLDPIEDLNTAIDVILRNKSPVRIEVTHREPIAA